MKIKQEELPTAERVLEKECGTKSFRFHDDNVNERSEYDVIYAMDQYLKLHLDRIRYEYNQYQFFLDGYRNGSASISEVNNAHNEFLKLLQ